MDFFKEQDKSRTKTTQLVGLFILAVLAVVLAVYAIAIFIMFSHGARQPGFNPAEFHWVQPQLAFWVVSVTLLVIFIGSVTKIIALAKGGSAVAENLGGRLINASTTDPDERRLINVVEEMSIASGVPVPQVYILDREKGINAFAAGYSPNDAVVAVTRNCLRLLNRDELQGVIAHEFSHILNGDMRLNIRLIGFLSGIMVLANIGYLVLRARTGSRKSGAQIVLIGIGLIVIGFVGQLFGRMIQAAAAEQLPAVHPENPAISGVSISQLSGAPSHPDASRKNAVVVATGGVDWDRPESWTGALDRSPCGTGTCAKMAALFAKGELGLEEDFLHDGVLGTIWTGRLIREAKVGDYRAVVPTLTGRAWISGYSEYVIDPADPFPEGYTVGDIWGTGS